MKATPGIGVIITTSERELGSIVARVKLGHSQMRVEIEDMNRSAQRGCTLYTIRGLLDVSKSAQASPWQGCRFVRSGNSLFSRRRRQVSIARVTEIISSSDKSFEDAIEKGIARAAKTLKNVEGAWVKEQKVIVKNGRIAEYRVDLKVTFILID
jgi:dodecin